MKTWHKLVVKSTLKALIPFKGQLRALKRRIEPYTTNPHNDRHAFTQGLEQIRLLRQCGAALDGDVIEVGSGWIPIIPHLFVATGANSVTLTDVERLMDDRTREAARNFVLERAADVARALEIDEALVRRRLAGAMPFTYVVPWKPEQQPTASVDIVVSRAVLEHIPQPVLATMTGAFHRMLRPNGFMCHIVDNSDHFEHRDHSISRVNFLRYKDAVWRLLCLDTQWYQNRLRHSDYRRQFLSLPFVLRHEEAEADPESLRDLATLPLAARFKGYSHDDLAVLTSTFVLQSASA